MRLPIPQDAWSREYQQRLNGELERADLENRKSGRDIELSRSDGVRRERLVLRSPDGTRWEITVDDSGFIAATSL
jgi:hypothetical protein